MKQSEKTNSNIVTKPQPKTNNKIKLKSWYANRYQIILIQRNILLAFTLASMIAVTVAVLFVKNIMSSKSLEPYVIEVEKKTGVPVVVDQLKSQHLTGDQMIKKYFINQYIQSASGYDPKNYEMDATKVRLFSVSNINSEFRKRIDPKELGPESSISIRIKSVQFPTTNSAQIRISKKIDREGYAQELKDEVINMDFYFADLELNQEERLVNPLGFQVSKYLVAEEIFNY